MTPIVGFILLTHKQPHQIIRLVNTLNRMFDHPPIACHHDFSKSDLPIATLASNVSLVQPHLRTGWGKFSVVEAMLRALQLMYETTTSPDWFILLSGVDYPIQPAKQILHDLASSLYDVHIHHEQIMTLGATGNIKRSIQSPGGRKVQQKLCYERYCTIKFRDPFLNKTLSLKHPVITTPFLPFSKNLRCFAGEHWFCGNRKAAKYLLEFHDTRRALASHYRRFDSFTIIPEESYYQTVYCNAPHLKVSNNNWRYIDWSPGGSHPKTLLSEDMPKIRASSAHFARKFDIAKDVRILNELDAIVG